MMVAIQKCQTCGLEISRKAKQCPGCAVVYEHGVVDLMPKMPRSSDPAQLVALELVRREPSQRQRTIYRGPPPKQSRFVPRALMVVAFVSLLVIAAKLLPRFFI
ncbi:MAG: hypothetical protein IT381_15890 [Deltaproteobacteria bacterium]|nr:hypothetical protein [Deltaproteobacteria bacterium]